MAFGKKLTSKGFLGKTISLISKGWLQITGQAVEPPTPTWCDYPHAVKLATKGTLGASVGTATKGIILRICVPTMPQWCDYPHAVKLATKGNLGAVVGTASKGVVLRICITEEPIEKPRTTGPARRGFREEEKEEQKCITITVHAYGTKTVTNHVVNKDVKISIEDVDVMYRGDGIIEIIVRNLKKND